MHFFIRISTAVTMAAPLDRLAESRAAYKEYEGRVANAQNEDYVFQSSREKLVRARLNGDGAAEG